MKYIESEKRQTDFKRILQTEALALRFQTKVLDVKALTPKTSIAEYNDLLTVDSWADECVAHNMDFVPCDFNAMQAIARKYKTENVMYSGVVSVRAPNRTIFAFLAPLVLYPLIPSFIADVLTPKRESMYFTSVLDIATSRRVSNYVNTMPIGETDDVIRTNLLLSLGKVMQKKPTKSK